MEPEGSLPCSQEPTSGLNPKPTSQPISLSGLFPSSFPTKILYTTKENEDAGWLNGTALGYGLDDWGSRPGRGWESVSWSPRPDQLWGPPSLLYNGYLGVNRPGRKADHSPPSSAEVKMRGTITPLPQYAFMVWRSVKAQVQLMKRNMKWHQRKHNTSWIAYRMLVDKNDTSGLPLWSWNQSLQFQRTFFRWPLAVPRKTTV
jgi:hypothetical protein